jgi:signal transduction histidine kinase
VSGEVRNNLKKSQLFWSLSDAQIDKLMEIYREESYRAGERIISEGQNATGLYVVEEGKVALMMEIRIGSRTKKQAVIDVISTGQAFGWTSLAERQVSDVSAACIEDTRVLSFSGNMVRRLCDADCDLDHKVMQELLRMVSDRLSSAKATLAQILSVTSHDLRAPLATVQSCLDVMLGGFTGEVNDKQKELLEGSKQRISDLNSLINNILDISFIEIRRPDFENVIPKELISGAIGNIEGVARGKGVSIKSDAPSDLPPVTGIPLRLQQVLTNLLGNAVKFSRSGSAVTVSAKPAGDFLQFDVADDGIGINPEDLPKIFDDFYRGKNTEGEGVGLGLSIAKKIVDAHGGKIWASSPNPVTGRGTVFSFTLPVASVAAKAEGLAEAVDVLKGAKVLVVDDDPSMIKVAKFVLESKGTEVTTAADGAEALERVEQSPPDLLILDLLMPRMDGFEVCKRLHEKERAGGKRIPVLVTSAVREESSRRRYELEMATELNIDAYLEKPFSPPALLQRVEGVLKRYQRC